MEVTRILWSKKTKVTNARRSRDRGEACSSTFRDDLGRDSLDKSSAYFPRAEAPLIMLDVGAGLKASSSTGVTCSELPWRMRLLGEYDAIVALIMVKHFL